MVRIVSLLAVAFLGACAALPADGTRALAEADHRSCVDRGHSFPSRAYERCRYDLADDRQERDWRNLRLMQFPRTDQDPVARREEYRSLPRAGFSCVERFADDGARWVDCGAGR